VAPVNSKEVIKMAKVGCYRGLAGPCEAAVAPPLSGRARAARAVAGVAFIASSGVLYVWPLALLARLGVPGPVLWVLAGIGFWLGLSHLVAAATSYRGCPEVGAIASVLLRRHVISTCTPWERLDRRLEGARREGRRDAQSSARAPTPV
jgi:hypothetical protein